MGDFSAEEIQLDIREHSQEFGGPERVADHCQVAVFHYLFRYFIDSGTVIDEDGAVVRDY